MALFSNDVLRSSLEVRFDNRESTTRIINGISTISPVTLVNRTIEIELGAEKFIPKDDESALSQLQGLELATELGRELNWYEKQTLFAEALGYVQLHDVWSSIQECDEDQQLMHIDAVREPPAGVTELIAVSADDQIAACHVYHFGEEPSEEEIQNLISIFSEAIDLGVQPDTSYDTTVFSIPPMNGAFFALPGDQKLSLLSSRFASLDPKDSSGVEFLSSMMHLIRATVLTDYSESLSGVGGLVRKNFAITAEHRPYEGVWGMQIPKKVTLKQ